LGKHRARDALWRDMIRAAHFDAQRDSKRIGQFDGDGAAAGEALYKYTRKPDNAPDATKSPVLFERNATHIFRTIKSCGYHLYTIIRHYPMP
jgi:hypothetical protein